ncbi:protein translocase SEC61 complex subunit gamma [Candidatus Micrarchaeota archaeon]|nr:protein translocase SEC61 complex subunit gamma [Candidatus Micrarchaeota archaeon]
MIHMIDRVVGFIKQSKRIFYMFDKPSMQEYKQILKVSGLGMIIIGIIGTVINFLFQLLNL